MSEVGRPENVAVTLDSYERGLGAYLQNSPHTAHPSVVAFRERLLALLGPGGQMLELGSGPGADAAFFEGAGLTVRRTDGALAFISRLREQGYAAELLDVTRDELGDGWDAIYANAVLLHLTGRQFDDLLRRAARAVRVGGLLAFTVKEGDGETWSDQKLGAPRYFHYWREPELRKRLEQNGWQIERVDHADGRLDPWLQVICRARSQASG